MRSKNPSAWENPTEGGDGASDIGNPTPTEGGDGETPVDKIVEEEENEEEEEEVEEEEEEVEEDKIVEEEEETQSSPIDSEKTEERGWNDKDDPVADGWRRRLIEKKKSIWFEELYNQDVATRAIEAIAGTENGIVARKTRGRKNVARGNLARENVDSENLDPENVWKDRLLDLESRLKIALDDGLQKMNAKIDGLNEKIDGLDSRVRSLEANVNFSRSQGDQRDEQQKYQQQRDQLRITTGGGEDEGLVTSIEDETSKGKGDGEGKKYEMEKAIEDEPSDKDAKKKKRKEQGGEPSKKTNEGMKKKKMAKTGIVRSPIMTRQKKA